MSQSEKDKKKTAATASVGRIGGSALGSASSAVLSGIGTNIAAFATDKKKQSGTATFQGMNGAGANTSAIKNAAERVGAATGMVGLLGSAAANGAARGGGGGYTQNPYTAQVQALYEQLMNRGDFKYDMQADPLYRQYADQYSRLGQQAMRDTMGTAAGLTGGYGNSYANTVGNQAYQQYMGQLNQMIPQFYDRAYQNWQEQQDDLLMKYQLAMEKEASARSSGSGSGSRTTAEDYLNALSQGMGQIIANGYVNQSVSAAEAETQEEQIRFDNYFAEWLKKLQQE